MKRHYTPAPTVKMPMEYVCQQCGVKNKSAKFPEMVHYDCRGCKLLLKELLIGRKPPVPKKRRALHVPAPWMDK